MLAAPLACRCAGLLLHAALAVPIDGSVRHSPTPCPFTHTRAHTAVLMLRLACAQVSPTRKPPSKASRRCKGALRPPVAARS
ncbi:MAG: hypothetical protein J3K34DRAFT_409128 [Monoraphidium minutum]|nr:MAG: hypothetical protein J3K34DRAFT_409128 [Monoraphidium minutum]